MADVLSYNATAYQGNGAFNRIRTAIAQYRVYRQTLNELRSLSTRELNDLGIAQGNVREIARASAYGL